MEYDRGMSWFLKTMGLGIAGAMIGLLIEIVFGGRLVPLQWPIIIGLVAGLMIGRMRPPP